METVDKPLEPICASCWEPLRGLWGATSPRGFLICGEGNCERWAAAQGERVMITGDARAAVATPVPPRRRPRPVCAHCHHWLPVARRHRFHADGREFCTLSCMELGPT